MGVQDEKVNVNEIIEDLLSDLPTNSETVIDLPSGKTAKVRPITFEEEKQIISLSKKGQDPSMLLMDKCVSDIDMSEILLVDKIYILFKLRELSFGSIYKFIVSCPACSEQQTISLDINDMPVERMSDADSEVTVTLPMCKKDVTVRRASVSDEKLISDTEDMFENLWRFVTKFDEYDDLMVIQGVLSKLPAGDINTMISEILCDGYGISTEVMVQCGACGAQTPMELPLDKNFFSVS